MIFRLFRHLREYKKPTIITLVLMVCEAVIEAFIPFTTAKLVNTIEAGGDVEAIVKTGLVLILMAMCSLACGGSAGYTCGKTGLAGFATSHFLSSLLFSDFSSADYHRILQSPVVGRCVLTPPYPPPNRNPPSLHLSSAFRCLLLYQSTVSKGSNPFAPLLIR